jgi:hypothetical protein
VFLRYANRSSVLSLDVIKTAYVDAWSMSGITLRRGTSVKNWSRALEREGHKGTWALDTASVLCENAGEEC